MSKTRRPKTTFILISIIGVLLVSGIFIYRTFKYRFVRQKLEQVIDTKSKGIYSLAYENLVINEAAGSISADHVRLIPDTAAYQSLVATGKQPSVLLTVTIPKLLISGVKTPKALLNNEIEGDKLIISDAVIEVSTNNYLKDTSDYSVSQELYKQILGKLTSIRMNNIVLEHATIIISNLVTHKTGFKGTDFSLSLNELIIDSLHQHDPSRIFFSRDIAVSCAGLRLPSKDRTYEYIFEGLEYSSASSRFNAKKIRIAPQLGEATFAKEAKISKDRYDFTIEGIQLINIDLQALLHKQLIIDSLTVRRSSFKIFRDISYPHDSISRVGKYPAQKLLELDIPVNIRELILEHSFIEYKERNDKSDSSGKVQFYDVRATISNLTNMGDRIKKNNIARLDFRSKFLNKADLHAVLTMYLGNPEGRFDVVADMGSMHATVLNPMIQPMALARIEQGEISKLHLQLNANDHKADGTLLFLYNDLKVTLLKKDDDHNIYRKKFLPSIAAGILIKDSNPEHGKQRLASIHYERDVYRSMFNLLWKSLFTGIKETVGVKK